MFVRRPCHRHHPLFDQAERPARPSSNTACIRTRSPNLGVTAALKLATVESDNRVRLQEMALAAGTAGIQADVADRVSARQREVDAKDTLTPRALAVGVTIGFFGILVALQTVGKPPTGGDALLVMLGALGGAFGSVIADYFGGSAGSERKTELMAKTTPAAEPNAATAP